MAELQPLPFSALVRHAFAGLREEGRVFQLPRRRFFTGSAGHDFSADFHGHRVGVPLGPAAGPHTQMAQNLVLAWLAGSRVFELKTVQVLDELTLPRPCIDMRTIGYNAEWSQELKVEQSRREYVKGALLVRLLEESGEIRQSPGFADKVWDISVGYDLEGIQSPKVAAFLDGMQDVKDLADELRREIPAELGALREVDLPSRMADTVTLSTFHGCPPEQIEAICLHLMERHHLHTVVKFNPMLLGPTRLREILHEQLGYDDLAVPDSAFTRDTPWEKAVGIVQRCSARAQELGLGFGIKLTNTLIVENRAGFLPGEVEEVYLSGAPLHVLAMHLVRRFRRTFGAKLPISFSAGIDRHNFPDAVALGLVPVTVCSDWLKEGGYGRVHRYFGELQKRMDAVDAATRDEFVRRAFGEDPGGDAPGLEAAILRNTEAYVDGLAADPRYRRDHHLKGPKKLGKTLHLLGCVTCDKCIPACPNDAVFALGAAGAIPSRTARRQGDGWTVEEGEPLELTDRHQLAVLADFCNECGNCDVFCPEDGGPYAVKPLFFHRLQDWRAAGGDGLHVQRTDDGHVVHGRVDGLEYRVERADGRLRFAGEDFDLELDGSGAVTGEGSGEVDLTPAHLLDWLAAAVLDPHAHNHVRHAAETTGGPA